MSTAKIPRVLRVHQDEQAGALRAIRVQKFKVGPHENFHRDLQDYMQARPGGKR